MSHGWNPLSPVDVSEFPHLAGHCNSRYIPCSVFRLRVTLMSRPHARATTTAVGGARRYLDGLSFDRLRPMNLREGVCARSWGRSALEVWR